MLFQETPIEGAFVIELERLEDERGFFAEGWKQEAAERYGIGTAFNRTNLSYNKQKGTVRGLHSQKDPYSEVKLVQCNRGAIFDVLVDVRPASATYGQWFGTELTAENHRMLYIPRGCLHGFQTLVDDTEVFYQVAGNYQPGSEVGARFDDPAFDIAWPATETRILSPKDQAWPRFSLAQPSSVH